MAFTNIGRVTAVLALLLGIAQIWLGGSVLFGSSELPSEALGNLSPGQTIERGVLKIIFAITLGTITELSVHAKKILDKI